jgi:hypothetical protein
MNQRQRVGLDSEGSVAYDLRETQQAIALSVCSAATRLSSSADSISRRSHSGAMSKPFGQVSAPNSRNTRAKDASSRDGSSVDPGSCTIAAKSCTPSLPSLNQPKAPKLFEARHFISIEACDPLPLLARAGNTPILTQLLLSRQRPLLDEAGSCLRRRAFDDLARFDGHERLVFAIDGMKFAIDGMKMEQ